MFRLKDSERFVALATGTELAHLLTLNDSRVRGCYHRYNPGKRNAKGDDWLKPIELYEWKKMSTMVSWTMDYFKEKGIKEDMTMCVNRLKAV